MIIAVSSHPVQYRAPLYRYLAQREETTVHAIYLTDRHLRDAYDPGFEVTYRWAMDLVGGYPSSFVTTGSAANRVAWWSAVVRTYATVRATALRTPSPRAILLHSYASPEAIGGLLAAKALRLPALLMEEVELTRHRSILNRMLRGAAFPFLLKLYDAFLYIGTRNRQFYERYRVDRARLFFTPYSVDNAAFDRDLSDNLAKREMTRRELGADATARVALFAGKLIPRKRPLDLLEAVALLPPDRRPFVAFVGAGQLDAALRARAGELGLTKLAILGFKNMNEIGRYYAAADIFVLPSQYETWGLVVNEAMVHGLPAVVSEGCGCAADLVRDGETGLRFATGNTRALAARLDALLRNEPLRRQLGTQARAFIQGWSYAEVAKGVGAALASVNSPRGGAPGLNAAGLHRG